MRIGSLFSGIGGLELGLEWSGIGETVWQVEQNPYCLDVLAKHWPDANRHTDVRSVGAANLAPVDLICGGFPCQDVSSAGRGAGLSGARSGLWFEYHRIVAELRPRWVVVENVASGAELWFDSVRGDLARIGYSTLPIPLSASVCGALHRRERLFILGVTAAYANGIRLQAGGFSERAQTEVPRTAYGTQHRERHAGWKTEPAVARMVYGLPRSVDREKALGNSVVPQCAEVVGHVIRRLEQVANAP